MESSKKFFIHTSECHLGITLSQDSLEKSVIGLEYVDIFMNNPQVSSVFAFLDKEEPLQSQHIKFCLELSKEKYEHVVIFCKTLKKVLNEEDLASSLQVLSVGNLPMLALYTALCNIFMPLILKEDTSLQKSLTNLQSELKSVLMKKDINGDFDDTLDFSSLAVVQSVMDEVKYWNNMSLAAKNRVSRSSGEAFSQILEPLGSEFSLLQTLSFDEVEDVLDNAYSILDDLWHHKLQFPKDRMENLMDIIGNEISKYSSDQLSKHDIWQEDFNKISEILSRCITLCERWLSTCKQLTYMLWPSYASHVWNGGPYELKDLEAFMTRLQAVLNIRKLQKQLLKLLTAHEQSDLGTDNMFTPFKRIDIFDCSQFMLHRWLKGYKQFEELLQPAEQQVAFKLKKQLAGMTSNARQFLQEASRYSELISRPTMKHILSTERQQLLHSLFDYVQYLQSQVTSEITRFSSKYDTPQVVKEIVHIRQLENKMAEVQKTSHALLDDLQGYTNLEQIVSESLKSLKQQHNELFEAWTEEISLKIKGKQLSLKESDPVIQFSKNKLMKVNYSPELVTLVSEVRHLLALGYHIPNHIQQISEHAKKFMKYAKTLEQMANFHNTVGERMIISQRPMMLDSALNLSKLVQEEEVVSWGEAKSVENYIETLKTAVDKLSKQNNLLASYHYQIVNKIKQLEDVDLIKDYSKWKDIVRDIRNITSTVEEKGFRNMQSWKIDIDQQLCKVLEKQYIKSFNTLHLYLPEIYTDLIFRDSKLYFSPSEKDLKEKYQQQLKRFLDIPKNFRGIADTQDKNMYADIVERNKPELDKVNKNTDELFKQLQDTQKHWEAWLQLEPLDVAKLSTWQHWDLHFRASKTFGQEVAKLPSDEEKVGCFLVGLSRLKAGLDSYNRSYWDQLVQSLKDSIAQDVVKLQNYIDPATAALTKQPVTVEEISEVGASHANILRQAQEMKEVFESMVRKTQTLANWTREQVDSVARLKGAWERLQNLLDNHQHIIAKQIEMVKTTLQIEDENLRREMEKFSAKWEQMRPKLNSAEVMDSSLTELSKLLNGINEKKQQWDEILEKEKKLTSDYEKYGLEFPEFSTAAEITSELEKEQQNWQLFAEFEADLDNVQKEEWIVFRKKIYIFEELMSNWEGKLKKAERSDLLVKILQEVNKYEALVPILKYVRGEDFTDKHWMEVFSVLGMTPKPIEILILKDFLDHSTEIIDHAKDVQAICKKAASEIVVRQALAELDSWDFQEKFALVPHTDSHDKTIHLVKDFKDILNKIGDNQSLLQSLKNSSDYDAFAERVNTWENKLVDLDLYISTLAQIQRKWVYLEPIFGSGTLAQEKSRFEKLDRDFRYIMTYIEKDTRVSALCRFTNLRSILENIQNQLGRCQNSLDNFLKEKRNAFPRFLFLSDDDLLEVVGQSSKEHVIQAHMKKIFAGINSIRLDDGGKKITSMCSLEGEVVPLINPVPIDRPIEVWLNMLVKEMQVTLKDLLVQCRDTQVADPMNYPSQILCLADNINFTAKCEQAISSMTLPPLMASYKAQLSHYSSLELSSDEDNKSLTSTTVSEGQEINILELKLKALILDTIHHISVLEDLLDNNVTKVNDWNWQRQLRFYANSTGEVTVKMANSRMEYAYEYLGNAQKLVRTPLTDRCFLTLTQGIHLGMGGNPYGPAGTGKTESVKALGALLGRQVLVFNCDEGIDASSMGRILAGLVKTGAWGCFDEFNRLDETTLSTISMYIQPIQEALRMNKSRVKFMDQEMDVNKHCGIFVTLNPAGGNYGGRNKLPDNLKQLFRPVVMTHPDHEIIAKNLLHCDGYQNADYIAKKLIEIFLLSSKLLSKQQHYDWGLRAIRTVVMGCGRVMKAHRQKPEITGNNMLDIELKLVVRMLRIDTLSKLTFTDSVKFDALISDVFKGVAFENMGNTVLVEALEASFVDLGLTSNKRQINKCLELYEQMKQRMGVAVVGPPSSGKTTLKDLLFHALKKTGKTIKQYYLNPKSITRQQLLGQINVDTRQWSDGVLTLYSLQVASAPSETRSCIICDGDIDPDWVESLNSVLDDNRLLTLPSGWRIQFGTNVNFLFETHTLKNSSPATISRMGIVFLSENDLNLKDYIKNYFSQHSDKFSEMLQNLVDEYFIKAVNWIEKEAELLVVRSMLSVVKTGLSQLENINSRSNFVVKLISGLARQIHPAYQEEFAKKIFEWTHEAVPPSVLKCKYDNSRDLIESYFTSPNISLDSDEVITGLPLVMTGTVLQALATTRIWLEPGNEQHFLLVGEHGSAKTLILKYLVKERADVEMVIIHCGTSLMPKFVISKIAQHCILVNTNKGKVYKPKKGHLVLHFKNLHLLKNDKWGTNILIQFLHQVITYKGFFDSNLEFVGLEQITVTGTMEVANTVSERFTSIIHIYYIEPLEQNDLSLIVIAYLDALLRKYYTNNNALTKSKVTKLSGLIISIYNRIRHSFNYIQHKHYIFSSHDVINWCSSVMRYANESKEDSENFLAQVICYDALRRFGDKLVNEADFNKLHSIIYDSLQASSIKTNIIKEVSDLYFVPLSQNINTSTQTSFHRVSENEWTEMVQKNINEASREGYYLDVLISKELLELCANILRAVSAGEGNLVLVGRTGVGRRSAVRITAARQHAKLIIPSSNQRQQFNNELKLAMQAAGFDSQQVYLLLEDHIMNADMIMNVVNTLIFSGEVPSLFTTTEIDSLVMGLKEEAARENFEGDLLQFFAARVKLNLHVIVCLDADNENLWAIFEGCPVLLQTCTILWKSSWSESTFTKIPNLLIDKMNQNADKANQIPVTDGFIKLFDTVKLKIPAPYSFIMMVRMYFNIYSEKLNVISTIKNKLKSGVSKITEAKNLVSVLKEDAMKQQEKLAEKQAKANQALEMISNTMKNANSHKEEMEVLKMKTEKENIQLMKRKNEIEQELADVEPLIQEARSAVGNIKTEALSEIRSLRAPPDIIRDILEGVLRLMGIQDTSWNNMKIFLSKRGVKDEIRSFDASRITSENRQAVERLMSAKSDSFDPKSAKRASVAAAPLAAWVAANVKYSHVLNKIKPLEREQSRLQQNLTEAESQLDELSVGLSDVDKTVQKLKVQLSEYTKEAAEIEIGLNKANETLSSAEGLVSKLSEEYQRWQEQLKEYTEELEHLPTNCLLASAFITYLSKDCEDERRYVFKRWLELFKKEHFDIEDLLYSEREQLQWQNEGLPSHQLAIQNAVVILKGELVPLLIDPASAAINWLQKHSKDQQIEKISPHSPKFNTTLELCIRFGKVLIIEELDFVPPVLYSFLRNEFTFQGERKLVNLNGKSVDYNEKFKLILHSRNEQLKLSSDVESLVSVLNFTVTPTGLTDNLLTEVVRQENPELEKRQSDLLQKKEELKEKQYELQNQLLENLANAEGDILQNANLLVSLNETKASSLAISSALSESQEIQEKLLKEYSIYNEIAAFGSLLYFSIAEFSKLNTLYVISVPAYTRLFLKSLTTYQGIENKPDFLKRHVLHTIYNFVCRGIFKKDRVKFALHLIQKIYPKEITTVEWNLFLDSVSPSNTSENDIPAWIPKQSASVVQNLQSNLPTLFEQLRLNEQALWQNFMNTKDCEAHMPKHCNVTEFQKVLVVAALRPDRLQSSISACILHLAGFQTLDPPVADFSEISKESLSTEPILLITTSGNDPSPKLGLLAEKLNKKFIEIAMGEGQENNALNALEDCSQTGQWLILKNLHLMINWLPVLCQKLQSVKHDDNFRLWLITEPHDNFNFVLAQNSLKIACETPQGIRNNLLHTYTTWGSEYFDKLNSTAARIFFVLSCIHAILQERRTYIPQGWSKWYDFSDTDFMTIIKLIEDLWQSNTIQTQWKFISGLCRDAVYGGRIENIDDIKIVDVYLKKYLKDDVLSHRWTPFRLSINLPTTSKFQDYLNTIMQFPNQDSPSFFGLPENTDRALQKQISSDIKTHLKSLYLSKIAVISFDKEQWYKRLSPYMNLWKKINQGKDFVRLETPDLEEKTSPIEIFMNEEYRSSITIIQHIHKCLTSLNKICKGVASPNDENLFDGKTLLNHEVPMSWIALWKGPDNPSHYMVNVLNKAEKISDWHKQTVNEIITSPIKLSLLFHPEAFISSFKQEFSRNNDIPIDQLVLQTSWKQPGERFTITLTDLLIEGAVFDGMQLKSCVSTSDNINSTVDCYIYWKKQLDLDSTTDDDKSLQVPLYYSLKKDKRVIFLQVPCDNKDKDEWILAGLSFYLGY